MKFKKLLIMTLVIAMLSGTVVFASDLNSENEAISSFQGTILSIGESDDGETIKMLVKNEEHKYTFNIKESTLILVEKDNPEHIGMGDYVFAFFQGRPTPELALMTDAVAFVNRGQSAYIGNFNEELLDENNTLKLNISEDTILIDREGTDVILEDLYNKKLMVIYESTTRSLPPQTTPSKVVVLNEANKLTDEEYNELYGGDDSDVDYGGGVEDGVVNFSSWAIDSITTAINTDLLPDAGILGEAKRDITREEFTEIIMKAYYQLGGKSLDTPIEFFEDTDNLTLAEANALGIVSGVGNNKFEPNKNITREEMAVILDRTMIKLDINLPITMNLLIFADSDEISDWADNSVQTMNKLGIIQGVGNDKINPKGNTTIEQAIVMAVRFVERLTEEVKPLN